MKTQSSSICKSNNYIAHLSIKRHNITSPAKPQTGRTWTCKRLEMLSALSAETDVPRRTMSAAVRFIMAAFRAVLLVVASVGCRSVVRRICVEDLRSLLFKEVLRQHRINFRRQVGNRSYKIIQCDTFTVVGIKMS